MMKRVVAALIVHDGKILVCQRTRHQTMPLKWEFPGGKIEDGEQARGALERELEEELGIHATIGEEASVFGTSTAAGVRSICVSLWSESIAESWRIAFFAICNGLAPPTCHRSIFLKPISNWYPGPGHGKALGLEVSRGGHPLPPPLASKKKAPLCGAFISLIVLLSSVTRPVSIPDGLHRCRWAERRGEAPANCLSCRRAYDDSPARLTGP